MLLYILLCRIIRCHYYMYLFTMLVLFFFRVQLVLPVPPVSLEHLALLACLVHLVPLVQLVPLVLVV